MQIIVKACLRSCPACFPDSSILESKEGQLLKTVPLWTSLESGSEDLLSTSPHLGSYPKQPSAFLTWSSYKQAQVRSK